MTAPVILGVGGLAAMWGGLIGLVLILLRAAAAADRDLERLAAPRLVRYDDWTVELDGVDFDWPEMTE